MQFSGVYTALITPFKDDQGDQQVDQDGLRANCQLQLEAGIDGLVSLGTTGETPTLTLEEQELVVRIAKEECGSKVPLIVGTGTNSTKTTIQRTQWAQELGADAALVVTPYYNRPTQEGIYLHFKAVCENTDLPILIYNIPHRCGQNITVPTLERIALLPNIYGVKEAGGSMAQVHEEIYAIANQRALFSVLSGDDELTIPLMAAGGKGIVSVASNLIPHHMVEMVKAMELNDLPKARLIFNEIFPLLRGCALETNPIPIKVAMGLAGMAAGPCRLPMSEISAANRQRLALILEELDLVRK